MSMIVSAACSVRLASKRAFRGICNPKLLTENCTLGQHVDFRCGLAGGKLCLRNNKLLDRHTEVAQNPEHNA